MGRFVRAPRAAALLVLWLVLAPASGTEGDAPPRAGGSVVRTLEDIYGDTGNSFQAALGFVAFEGTPDSEAVQSYGLAVDDVVVKWKEFTLDPDETDCAVSGSCAVVELSQSTVFEAQATLAITVLDAVPDPQNDCDLDGAPDGTTDCNGNLVPDVVVRSTSPTDVAGEISYLDREDGGRYRGSVTLSAIAAGPGVLFVAPDGAAPPAVTVTYLDHDIDPGPQVEPCPNNVDPAQHGIVHTSTTVLLGASCDVSVVSSWIVADNGDHDTFADTAEIVELEVCLLNNCGADLHGCTGRLFGDDPRVDCILDGAIDVGELAASGEPVCITEPFRFRVADVERPDVDAAFDVAFGFSMTCDEIDALSRVQTITLPLDLDLDASGQTPVAWVEGFESGSLAESRFFAENLDAGIPGQNNTEGLINGDGWRCQYSDPDWTNSNRHGTSYALDCFPGATLNGANAIYWGVDGAGTGAPDGGRAKTGSRSLYYGIYLDFDFTTPQAMVESVATSQPINLGVALPELSWWQQVSLMDGRFINMPTLRSADRGVVQYKTIDASGIDTSAWARMEPFQNPYKTQGYDFFFGCMFDPVDDGTTEDDFFDPTDPARRLGPSSTCHPEFAYSCQGDTDQPFQVTNVCNATTPPGPGDAGALGTGTWVQSRVDLSELRGKRIRLRFLVTGHKATASETWDGQFAAVNPGEWDNGWWIDDVTITESLTDPAVLEVDTNALHSCDGGAGLVGCLTDADCADAGAPLPCAGAAPSCGPTCTGLTAAVATDPEANGGPGAEQLGAPGQPLALDASASSGVCLDGALQFRFVRGGVTVREFSENPIFVDAPVSGSAYEVTVRCSALPSCAASTTVDVTVHCPVGPTPLLGSWCADGLCEAGDADAIVALSPSELGWSTARGFQALQGPLSGVGTYTGSITSGSGNTFGTGSLTPGVVDGIYTLFREAGALCNEVGSWSGGGTGECAAPASCHRDADIAP